MLCRTDQASLLVWASLHMLSQTLWGADKWSKTSGLKCPRRLVAYAGEVSVGAGSGNDVGMK
jgi:hypothetical protein